MADVMIEISEVTYAETLSIYTYITDYISMERLSSD